MRTNKCPSCGGFIEFDPISKNLKCQNCSNLYPIKLNTPKAKRKVALAISDDGFKKWQDSKRTFQCKNCGAQITLNKFEASSICSYCNTSSLVPTEKLPGLKPDVVVPFKISKPEAKRQFKLRTLDKKFLPNDFRKRLPELSLGANYFSSFSFGINIFASYHGIRAVTRTIHTSNGTKTVTDLIPFSGTIQKYFDNIIVESSEKISQNEINSILPYNFKESYEYNDDFVTGFNVEYYNQSVSDASITARKEGLRLVESIIRSRHSDIRSLTIKPTFSNETFNYTLLPLYFINFKYKDKEYLNLMNGQTGKTSGKVPRSATKITFFVLAIILFVIGIPLLIALLTSL